MENTIWPTLWSFICQWAPWYFLAGTVVAIVYIIVQSRYEGWGILKYLGNPESWDEVFLVLFLWPFWIFLLIFMTIADLPDILASFFNWIESKVHKGRK